MPLLPCAHGKTVIFRLLLAALLVAIAACEQADPVSGETIESPQFVGSQACGSCHRAEFERWQGSHHQLAMQPANADTVLGDFSGTAATYLDNEARFSTRDGRYVVTMTDGTGQSETHAITHTFGVTPLQQYLVDAPGGRKQVLQFAWDARPRETGGQRWYHLYADEEIAPGDPLHWRGRRFNWNFMCAECHSTGVDAGYDAQTDSFATSYAEVSVGCEACHGPGSVHAAQATANRFDAALGLVIDLDERHGVTWNMNAATGMAERSRPNTSRRQPEACGRCHARRSVVAPDYEYGRPLADTHMIALLEEDLYHADGRMLGEVYVYGSFVQSRMYAAGVTCSDCHEPHSGDLRAGPDPNDTCSTCHLREKFAASSHAPAASGDCVSCHMQARTYMGVDDRRDHSFRLPGTADDPGHYGAAIAAGRRGGANDVLLAGIANPSFPPIARATMLTLLEPVGDAADAAVVHAQLDDPDPLVRIGALRALRKQPPRTALDRGSQLLRDPVRSVRIEAALTYAGYRDLLPRDDARAFPGAADDFRDAMTATAAMPEAALNLAEFERRLGNQGLASDMYEHALRIGEQSPAARHAYGLHLVRDGQLPAAIDHLRAAARLDPDTPQFVYVYGVALNSMGNASEAVRVLADAWERFPQHFDIGWALATVSRDRGDVERARALARQLVDRFPERPQAQQLLTSLGT